MTSSIKFTLTLLIYTFTYLCDISGEIILTEDREYDVINFQIPHYIWLKAINPTPILKSAVTVTLPVRVENENTNYVEDEDEVQEETGGIVDETVAEGVAEATPSPISDGPAVETESTTQKPVFGQAIKFPCSCVDGQCGCCTGTIMQKFNMKACGNISFIPEDFVFDVRMSVNNNTVVHQKVSASDPPPICFNPRRVPFVRVCAEISNIRIRNKNAFACLDITADIADFPIYSASFRCFGLGTQGVQTNLKPQPQVTNGPKPINIFGNGGEDDGGIVEDAAEEILGGGPGPGPLAAFGNAVGGFFGAKKRVKTKLDGGVKNE